MPKELLLTDAIQQYLQYLSLRQYSENTLHGYEIDLKQLSAFLMNAANAPVYLDEITVEHLEAFQQQLVARQLSPASMNRKIHSMKSLFKWAMTKKFLAEDVTIGILPFKLPHTERHFLTSRQLQQFLKQIPQPTIQVIAQFVANTGLRITECTQLQLTHIDWERRLVHVVHGKGKKSRKVPLNDRVYTLLKHYLDHIRPKGCPSLYLFALQKTGSISPQYINAHFKEASNKIKSPQLITCHILRHTFASNLVKQNVHIAVIQKLLGHSNVRTTSIYMHTDFEALHQAVNTLNPIGGTEHEIQPR